MAQELLSGKSFLSLSGVVCAGARDRQVELDQAIGRRMSAVGQIVDSRQILGISSR